MTREIILLALFTFAPATGLAQSSGTTAPAPPSQHAPEQPERDRLETWTWKGFRPVVDTVVSGSGLAVGFEYLYDRIGGMHVGVGADAMISVRNYQDLALRIGGLSYRTGRMRLEPADRSFTSMMQLPADEVAGWAVYLEQRYRRLPSLSLYGSTDPDTTVRTDFGQRAVGTDIVFQLQTIRTLGLSARVGYLKTDPFAGTDSNHANTDTVFSDGISNALTTASRYIVGGLGAGLDHRDHPWRPKRGSAVAVSAWRYISRSDAFTSFSRVSVDLQSFKQVGTLRHVMAARVVGTYTGMTGDRELPFHLTQALGGSHTLRSFPSYRFRGESLTAATLESRWRIWRPVEVVLFVDVGHVAKPPVPNGDDQTLTSLGAGARYWFRNRYALRADVARGRDGVRLVATLGGSF